MKSFNCQKCGQVIFFENVQCLRCLSPLGYIPELSEMSAFDNPSRVLNSYINHNNYKLCKNGLDYQACNWVLDLNAKDDYCHACSFNRTVPNLEIQQNMKYWQILESGKRRLFYSLLRFALPLISKNENETDGLAFEFLKDTHERIQANDRVLTGHSDGIITLNIAEADDAERERRRLNLNEDYRTVLGHFRHESGHYYWQLLVANSVRLAEFRDLFGDEQADYQSNVAEYYRNGPQDNWQDTCVSAYASCHAWEDFAETWGHYITIADTLETATEFGVSIDGVDNTKNFDSYNAPSFDTMLERWLPLTFTVNNINRSGGRPDLYPFVLSATVIDKLRFVHSLIQDR
ncbi:MAG: putative zinc-binding metallopeptidase [Pseudomonadales bacterium]|nr:putative zinc-binding metallopeptidase [Pseudomonadales bacterium]MDP7315513.1 putative zinc-binding metallopeptidase [Pseudomonadales bacterium]